jgi:predicted HTH domain antitoxin
MPHSHSTPDNTPLPAQFNIPQDIFDSARLSVDEVKLELALALYARRRFGLGKTRELAGLSMWEFRQILASRKIPPHYDTDDLFYDMVTLRGIGGNL